MKTTANKQIRTRKVYIPRVYGIEAPLGGYANFYFTKKEAKAEIQRYIDAGRITKGYVETGYLEY